MDILEVAGRNVNGELASIYKGAKLPIGESQLKHIFASRDGHIIDTPANRQLLESVAGDGEAFAGIDEKGLAWFSRIQEDGSQVWVKVYKSSNSHYITDAGVNLTPRSFDQASGFNKNPFKKGNKG